MEFNLKKVKDQVIVITGASSGIGLATAKMAAKQGARVVLSSRNERELARVADDIRAGGGKAVFVPADVSDAKAVEGIAEAAIREFGGFDTWFNNAGVSVFGKLPEVPLAEKRRVFDVNFWGVVHGCRVALPHLRQKGGAMINMGSMASVRAMPLQGIYAASKHAIKGYTDALRMELEEERVPVSVTLIMPASINTPFPQHARNHLAVEPKLAPPLYAPQVVARAVLISAETPQRDVFIGAPARLVSLMETLAPRAADVFTETVLSDQQKADRFSSPDRRDNLFDPLEHEGRVDGQQKDGVYKSSTYTSIAMRPAKAAAAMTARATELAHSAIRLIRVGRRMAFPR